MEKAIKDLDIYISDGNYSAKYPRSEEFVDKGIPFIRANNILDGDVIDDDMYYITPEKHKILQKGHVQTGDILITTRGNIGQVAIVPERHNDSNINAQIVLLRITTDNLYNRYLLWALQSNNVCGQYQALQTGTALKQLPVGKLEQVRIRLTEIDKQHTIANNLDKTYRIIKARQHELKLLDDLIKARFVEMFVKRSYPQQTLISLIKNNAGLSYGIVQPGDDGTGDMGVLRPVDLIDGHISTKAIKYINRSIGDGFKKTELTGDELLITVRGTTGVTALTNKRFAGMNVTRGIAVIRYDRQKINPEYLNTFLNSDESQRYIQEHTRGATLQQINLSDLRVQMVIVPPMELQEQFAAFVAQVDKTKEVVKKSLDKAQLLFDSLMQRYFG